MKNNVLVTGIGGNVGYGVLRNIRNSFQDVFLIGTNTNRVSAGNHYCDVVKQVSFSTEPSYINEIVEICNHYQVSLIIPTTDFESHILSLHQKSLPKIAVSPAITTETFLDKYETYCYLKKYEFPFAESILPSNYNNQFQEIIVKPRKGRGSRGIFINPKELLDFDDSYIIQPYVKGVEVTIAFYVTKSNELYGFIALSRTLSSGATDTCEVYTKLNSEIESLLNRLIKIIEIRGACNVQCIIDEKNNIIPFEVNCRISGTNSIRAHFGFKDVDYTLNEYLFGNALTEKPIIKKGSAIRMIADIIYVDQEIEQIIDKNNEYYVSY